VNPQNGELLKNILKYSSVKNGYWKIWADLVEFKCVGKELFATKAFLSEEGGIFVRKWRKEFKL
jgi:hypothetical protein